MQYKIIGEPMPVVECTLEAGESMVTERGSMTWMSANMQMSTSAGGKGGLGKMLGRAISGESIFQNTYTAQGGQGLIAFGSSFTGSIRAYQIVPGRSVIVQKSGYLASESGVQLSIHFNRKLGAGLLGGEGFVMQKLSGQGTAFVEIDGFAVEYDLAPGQTMIVNPGNIAVMDESVSMDVQSIKGVKNVLFGGENWFQTTLTGPGKIVLQTMTISGLAGALLPYLPKGNG
ncbi:MAG: AIM24 family protein [Oscillospiraceae bacterium]|nr:AIM24 family protein [Oscillospiraceae bacterium]